MKWNFPRTPLGYLLLIVVFAWIGLAIVFGIFDLNISMVVVDESSPWGAFGREYGELPSYGLIAIAFTALIGGHLKGLKRQRSLGGLSIIAGIAYLIYAIMRNDMDDVLLGIFFTIPTALFMIYAWDKDWKAYRAISKMISILAILGPLLFVQVTKLLFGRVRFRDLNLDFSNFTPWYLPQGITGNESFPSGHAAMGFIFLPLLILVKDSQLKAIPKILAASLIVGWGLFVGLSRIVVGAHYASDVLFSIGVDATITILLYRKYYAK